MPAMYQLHFGLHDLPFSIAPDPRYLYMSERHREALAHLLYGLKSNGAFILLTGDVGTGKTTVSRCLLEQIPAKTRLALVLNPMMSAIELLQAICDELHISRPVLSSSIKVHVDLINNDLIAAHARGEDTVVLIDEAQNLAADVLEQLRMLTNLETAERKLLQIILLGQPELRDHLAQPNMAQLSQRITARYHLSPLNLSETRAYVQHRLQVAGCREALFADTSLRRLHQLSKGVPRLINVLCDRAMLGAYVQNRARINVQTINNAAEEVFGVLPQPRRYQYAVLAIMFLALVMVAGWYVYNNQSSPVSTSFKVDAVVTVAQPAAIPAPVQDIADAKLIWPDADHALRSNTLAFQRLFNLWGLTYQPEQSGTPCYFAQARALDCLNETGDLQKLLAYNRPVILKLYDDHGDMIFAVLVAIQNDALVLDIAGKTQSVKVNNLPTFWRGEFTLLWQKPPGYTDMMDIGYAGADVQWLRQKLKIIYPQSVYLESADYDAVLAQQVKQFQQQQGLLADGVAGVQTLLHIIEASGATEPTLLQRNGEQG